MDAFVTGKKRSRGEEKGGFVPLAERLRPTSLSEIIGQEHLVGDGVLLRRLVEADHLCSIILWGPPGCGKTTLAKVLAKETSATFVSLSAVTAGVGEVRSVISAAMERKRGYGAKTILFLDEVHRFNKAQQDALLPSVESGVLILIGATTENPSFEVNAALLSRCRVFTMKRLGEDHIVGVLQRALSEKRGYASKAITIGTNTLRLIANYADGDARCALNTLEMAVEAAPTGPSEEQVINDKLVAEAMQRTGNLQYDKNGEQHYNTISALHKSMRGSDADASLYWLGRMLEGGEDAKYIARRLVRAPKSIDVYQAYNKVKQCIRSQPNEPVPMQIRNASTPLMKSSGYGRGYVYNPDADYATGAALGQQYLPDALVGQHFLQGPTPTKQDATEH